MAKLFFQKLQLILSLWKIFFSSEKGSPSMWLQMRSWNVFSLLNGTSWKIFCFLLSSESPWGHPSQRAPAQKDSLKKIFHICQPCLLRGRGGCTEAPLHWLLVLPGEGMSEATRVCAGRKEHEWDSYWLGQSCRVLSRSPLAMQLLKTSQGTVAAKGGCSSCEPKCPSYYANPTMPQTVCYRHSYFQMRLFLKASLTVSCCSQNTCTTSSSGSVCCTTWFQNQKHCIKVPEEKEKHIVIIPPLLISQRWGTIKQFQHFRKMSAEFETLSCNNLN